MIHPLPQMAVEGKEEILLRIKSASADQGTPLKGT
jgi:hypothetical protein